MLDSVKPFVLDVRRQAEFREGHIAGAPNIAHTRLLSRLTEVPKDRPILVNCQGGVRSARACSLLQKHGYSVTNLAGGFGAGGRALGHRLQLAQRRPPTAVHPGLDCGSCGAVVVRVGGGHRVSSRAPAVRRSPTATSCC